MKFSPLKLDNQICHRLYMASNGIVRTYREALLALDLTYPQYVVMMALWEKEGISIHELLEKTAIDGGAMTQILKKMTDKQLVEIIKDDQDKRKRLIKLQQAGYELQQRAVDIPAQIRCKFPSISEQEATQLITLLDKLNNDLISQ